MSRCPVESPSETHLGDTTVPTRRAMLALALGSAAALSGCIMVPVGRYPRGDVPRGDYPRSPPSAPGAPQPQGPDGDDEVVNLPPPAPQAEVWVAAPGPGFFWIAGHWIWRAGRHLWVGGRWHAHRPGWRWVPHSWQRHSRGWRAAPGQWQRQ